jgi:hypothetical protein
MPVDLSSVSAIIGYSRKLYSNLAHCWCRYSADIKMGDETRRILKSKNVKT